jgi:anti-sigma factor RsiW
MTGFCRHAAEPELGAFADGQLEGTTRQWWDEHIRTCVRCRDEVGRIRTLGAALRSSLPTSEPSSALRDSIRQIIRAPAAFEGERRPRRWTPGRAWASGIAAMLLVGAGFGLGRLAGPQGNGEDTVAQVVDAHLRALQVDHLVDVVSTDHHVVKPWFAGKLDFSPPVPDLAADGFPMLGGRTEYLDGRAVAALVYERGPHRVNLFTWPAASAGACGQAAPTVRLGLNVVHGRTGGMEFWAVSDLNPGELRQFASDWLREAGKGDGRCGSA